MWTKRTRNTTKDHLLARLLVTLASLLLTASVAFAQVYQEKIGGAASCSEGGWGDCVVSDSSSITFQVPPGGATVIANLKMLLTPQRCNVLVAEKLCEADRTEMVRVDGELGFSKTKDYFFYHTDDYWVDEGGGTSHHTNVTNDSWCGNFYTPASVYNDSDGNEITTLSCYFRLPPGNHVVDLSIRTGFGNSFGTHPKQYTETLEVGLEVTRSFRSITVDPGHGTNCPSIGQLAGAIGDKDYPSSDPPAGYLKEDELTVSVAQALLPLLRSAGWVATATKSDVTSCPSLLERGEIANHAHSDVFVSLHFNAPTFFNFSHGSSGLYNSAQPASEGLAELLAEHVSATMGLSNRGTKEDNSLAVLKPTVTRMPAAIIEVGRLSNPDEDTIHASGSSARAAAGIQAAIADFFKGPASNNR